MMVLKSLPEYELLAAQAHGHLCAGQILGLRMALHGVALLGLEDPAGADRKRLVTFVEIDRCMTDAITVVTGCRLGKRALKFRDFGKAAATFCDLRDQRAVRIAARESSKQRARELYSEIADRNQQQMHAYREMSDAELFDHQWVTVAIGRKTCRVLKRRGWYVPNVARASTFTVKWSAKDGPCAAHAPSTHHQVQRALSLRLPSRALELAP